MLKRDTCIKEFKDTIRVNETVGQKTFEECGSFIKRVKECRHNTVMQRQKLKYEALQQKKNGHPTKGQKIDTCTDHMAEEIKKWVKNLSTIPLTADQERLLAQGQNLSSSQRNLLSENT